MSTYQGPHVEVKQEFEINPGAVAVENLPSVSIATAYDVYVKESMGSSFGFKANTLEWPTNNKVVYNKSVAGQRNYDYYPAIAYANTPYGNIDLELTANENGFPVGSLVGSEVYDRTAFTIPGTEKIEGICQAIIPFYVKTSTVKIEANDLQTVVITNGSVVTARIRVGQKVFIKDTTWKEVGVVGVSPSDETRIRLSAPYTAAITAGTDIVIGAADGSTLRGIPDTIYDPMADFISAKVKVGDLLFISSRSITDSMDTPQIASVKSILDKNTLKFNTATPVGVDDLLSFKAFTAAPTNTINVTTYSVKRMLGFIQSYDFDDSSYPGVTISGVPGTGSKNNFTFLKTAGTIKKGDYIAVTNTHQEPTGATTNLHLYIVDTVETADDPLYWKVTVLTTDDLQTSDTNVDIANGNYLHAFWVRISTDITADFRAIRSEEHMVVKRITSLQDIATAWGSYDIHNDLAYMAFAQFSINGGRVLYGINVDSSASNLAAEYGEALEEMKMYDVYSHALGTTDAGVNALLPAYCDEQSDPYEGHERIATAVYDEKEAFLMGSDSFSVPIANHIITITGAFDPIVAGVTVGDLVEIYNASGTLLETATVTSTPTVVTEIHTDTELTTASGSIKVLCGRKDAQAILIHNLGFGNRRVTVAWPGWFYAQYNGNRILIPPYILSACVTGMDGGILVSQSFTNYNFTPPGLSNIELNTSSYFRKAQLDEIGSGGIDIMIQDARITNIIKSRHDLTSNMDAIEYRERSITKQADTCAKTIRSSVAPYAGRFNITDTLFVFLGKICSVVCNKLQKDGIIKKIAVTDISQDPVIIDKINFTVNATVFVAGNYYDITLYVKSR